ncbi:MAG: Dabb family protein [Clostridium lundense]|nr:Dabb family protein [Clostridium lundense]
MIKHIVMWKLKEFADGKDKEENAKIIKTDLENLQDKINEIKFIEVGINVNSLPQSYDIVLYSQFENMEDLNIYQNHPEHIKVGEFVKKVVNKRVVVDYEV